VIKALDEFSDQSRDAWRTATADTADAVPLLDTAVLKYQVQIALCLQWIAFHLGPWHNTAEYAWVSM